MQESLQRMLDQFAAAAPRIIGALVLLVIGFLVAALAGALVRGALRRTHLDDRLLGRVLGRDRAAQVDTASAAGRIIFWLVLAFFLVAVFQALGLTLISEPLNALLTGLLGFLPKLLGAILLALIAWVLATLLRMLVTRGLGATGLDERVGQTREESATGRPLSQTLGDVAYYLVFLFFLPAILSTLDLVGLLGPVQNLVTIILSFLPNLISAALIVVIGVFVARLVRNIVTNLLAAAGVDRLSERVGLAGALGRQRLSGTLGLIVYVLILLPVILAALEALRLQALTAPVSAMINRILTALPNIFAAAIIIALAYIVGRVLATLIANLLAGLGFDGVPARLGLGSGQIAGRTPSELVGWLVQAALIYFAVLQAIELLGFSQVTALLAQLLNLAGSILLGLIIFAVGLWLARLAARAIRGSDIANAGLLATIGQAAILIFAGAIALKQMGVADSIINLAFGLLLGAVAVASAIAFGIGGRDVAGRELDRFVQSTRARANQPAITPPATPPSHPTGGATPGAE